MLRRREETGGGNGRSTLMLLDAEAARWHDASSVYLRVAAARQTW